MNTETMKKMSKYRWRVCALVFFATTVNYLDRQVLSILAPTLQQDLGWSEIDYGHIVFSFQLAYALAMVLAGRLIDKFGTKIGYAVYVGLWSIAAMFHAAARSTFSFGVARFGLGLSEAGNFPAANKAVAEWFPKKERALATGIYNSGAFVASISAPIIVPWLALTFGWQSAFIAIGAVGFLWIIAWWLMYEKPEDQKGVTQSEMELINSDPPEPPMEKLHWLHLLRYRGVWAFVVGKFFSDPIWWFFLFWLPKFLNEKHGLNIKEMGAPLVVIYGVCMVGSIGAGWLASKLISRGWSINRARKTVMLVCALATIPVGFAARLPSLWIVVALISLATAGHCGWMANLFALVSDIFPKKAVASVTGIGGMAGALGGMFIAEGAGWLLEKTGAYWPIFVLAGCSYVTAWIIICLLVPKIETIKVT
jgi:ACS family hexuronate transporter-like MFS transporter